MIVRSATISRVEDQRAIAGSAQLDAARAEAQLDLVAEIRQRADVEAVDKDLQRLSRLDFELQEACLSGGGSVAGAWRRRRRVVGRR